MLYTPFCFFILLAGCAGVRTLEVAQPQYSRVYTASYEEVWEGTMKALEGLGIELKEANKAAGQIETGWFYREVERAMGLMGIPWKERYRMHLTLVAGRETTVVNIRSLVEEKRPGGTQAYRWTRKASTGEVEDILFREIDKALAVKEKK